MAVTSQELTGAVRRWKMEVVPTCACLHRRSISTRQNTPVCAPRAWSSRQMAFIADQASGGGGKGGSFSLLRVICRPLRSLHTTTGYPSMFLCPSTYGLLAACQCCLHRSHCCCKLVFAPITPKASATSAACVQRCGSSIALIQRALFI